MERPFDWNKWLKRYKKLWKDTAKSDENYYGKGRAKGYRNIKDFPSFKLDAIKRIEKDIKDGYTPNSSLVKYVQQTSETLRPIERRIGILDWERRKY